MRTTLHPPRKTSTRTGWRHAAAFGAAAMLLMTGACADGGVPDDGPRPATVSMRIVGGTVESGFAAVGALVDPNGAFCTGTLVAPTTVVTAAHCVEGIDDPAGLGFFVGQDARQPNGGTTVPVASVHAHPDYDGDNDIAVLKLGSPPPVTPIPYLKTAMGESWVGQSAIFVGYGVTGADQDDAGVKRSVAIDISAIMATAFEYVSSTKNTCFGDSGGPALAQVGGQYHLLGVTSYGDEGCAEYGVNNRVDPYEAWIEDLIAQSGETSPPSATPGVPAPSNSEDICAVQGWYGDGICDHGCADPDPDCEGMDDAPLPECGGAAQTGEDYCAIEGWYGDGICDVGCANPDPDCQGLDDVCHDGSCGDDPPGPVTGDDADLCAAEGWYGDGVCDADCPQPDPDCDDDGDSWDGGDDGGDSWDDDGEDFCAAEGWYGDGVCDVDCPQPDPDC